MAGVSFTVYELLFLTIPFIIVIVGAKSKYYVLIPLAGFFLVILPFFLGFPLWLDILIAFLGVLLIWAGVMRGIK